MTPALAWIAAASIVGGVLSAFMSAIVSLRFRYEWLPMLVSFAVGALLGAAFLELLPHAIARAASLQGLAATVLAGILAFFVLEKLVIWRHCHAEECEAHAPHEVDLRSRPSERGRAALIIIIGDSFHNFVDGVLIAAAFLESSALGIVTAAAVIAHEIPQEVGDYLVLLHSGLSRVRALVWNVVSSLAMLVGGLAGYFALDSLSNWTNTFVAIAVASMIYVAIADLIPGLHRRTELRATVLQVLLIGLGILTIAAVSMLTHHA